ncbi:GAF domain-containing protein [Knoellia sp. CPCC 206450]|uniref:GAF domain-containing sensor histidine kinase n=1 Tax=Knoellia tibetensis TaxID=3404798 RepID=UPI003B430187
MTGSARSERPPAGAGAPDGGQRWPLSSLELDDLVEELRARADSARVSQERLGSLLDAVIAVSSDLELAEVLRRIVVAACELVDATYGALGVLGPSGEELVEFVTHGVSEEQRAAIGPLPRGHGLLGMVIASPRAQRVPHIGQHPDSYGFPPNHPPMTSFLGAPVRIRDQVFGNLYLTDKRSAPEFSSDDEAVLSALAAAAGVAIENARLYERARTQRLWGEVIGDATQALLEGTAQEQVLADVTDSVCRLARADACLVALRKGSDIVVAASSGAVDPDGEPGKTVREPRILSAMLGPAHTEPGAQGATRAMLPIALGESPLGVLVADWAREEPTVHVPHLELLGRSLAVSLGAASARTDRARSELLEDRDRIARDMHDNVIQRLFATGMSLQSAAPMSPPEVRAKLDRAVDELDAAITDIRHTIFALHRVPGGRPLSAEIATVCGDAAVTLGFSPELRMSGPLADVPEAVAAELLSVVREALSNAARHAAASSVTVVVEVGDDVSVVVTDDGRGLPEGVSRSGLGNLARRAEGRGGSFSVGPADGSGTRVHWRVPLGADDRAGT